MANPRTPLTDEDAAYLDEQAQGGMSDEEMEFYLLEQATHPAELQADMREAGIL